MSFLAALRNRVTRCLQVPGGGLPVSPKPGTPQSAKRGGLARWRGTEQEGSPLKGATASQQRNAFTTRCVGDQIKGHFNGLELGQFTTSDRGRPAC